LTKTEISPLSPVGVWRVFTFNTPFSTRISPQFFCHFFSRFELEKSSKNK
jgi:hypothetical protein